MGLLGQLIDPLRPKKSVLPNPTADPSLESLIAPASNAASPRAMDPQPTQAPPANEAEFEQKVERNKGFLSSPEVQAGLLQFAISVLQPGQSFGGAFGEGLSASGRIRTNEDIKKREDQKLDLDERGMAVQEGELKLKEDALGTAAHRKYSKIVYGDSPIGIELGIPAGQSARVEFEEDKQGNLVNASVQANPITGNEDGGKSTQVTKLLNEADQAEAAGDTKRAALLRTAATKEATGASLQGTLSPDTRINDKGESEVIPGSPLDIEQKAATEKGAGKRIADIQMGLNVKRATDAAINQIEKSNFPDWTITGFGSYLEFVRGTGANDLARTLDTVKANLGFIKLQDIRDASKTGGALGPVSDFENRLMQATVANLEASQSAAQLSRNLKYVRAVFTDVELQGQLTVIGNKVKSGELNEAQAVQEAAAYMETLVNGEEAAGLAATKDISTTPATNLPPKGVDPGVTKNWDFMTADQKLRAEALARKKKER